MAFNFACGAILKLNVSVEAREHKGGVRIGKTPKKLTSICCP
jgi:hypothetical protein